jgi:CRISPR/Cas system CMR subunit Cmr6 (Cas7 group RAMP superfamily)
VQGVTFKPQISKMAQRIHRPKDMSTWERLSVGYSNQKPMLEARMQMMRIEDKAKEVEECTFAPKINKQSKKMMNQRTEVLREHRITAHEQLFQVQFSLSIRLRSNEPRHGREWMDGLPLWSNVV